MVKRPPSPKLHKTSNLVVIWQPFPLNSSFEKPEDCKQLFVWVSVVLGSYEHVLAIHHKPSVRFHTVPSCRICHTFPMRHFLFFSFEKQGI
jgi:formate dehydrogenase maturation protein FdhE